MKIRFRNKILNVEIVDSRETVSTEKQHFTKIFPKRALNYPFVYLQLVFYYYLS